MRPKGVLSSGLISTMVRGLRDFKLHKIQAGRASGKKLDAGTRGFFRRLTCHP